MSRRVRRRALHPLWANLKLKSATRFPSLFCSIQYSTWHTNSHRKYRTCLGSPPIKGHSKVTEAFMFGEVELQAYNADTNSTRISWRDRESTLITERIKIPASKIQLLEKSHWHNYTQILARTKIFFTLRNLSTELFFSRRELEVYGIRTKMGIGQTTTEESMQESMGAVHYPSGGFNGSRVDCYWGLLASASSLSSRVLRIRRALMVFVSTHYPRPSAAADTDHIRVTLGHDAVNRL